MTINREEITAIIAAGGKSSRFGEDKAGFAIDGEPLVKRVYRNAEAVADFIWIGLPQEADGEPAKWAEIRRTCMVLEDQPPGIGPLGTLHPALKSCPTPWLLFLACDLPGLRGEDLRLLVEAADGNHEVVAAAGPDGRPQPMVGIYRSDLAARVEAQILGGHYSLHGLLDRCRVKKVALPASSVHNMNTPEDTPRHR